MKEELSSLNVQPMILLGSDAFLSFDDLDSSGKRKWTEDDIQGLVSCGIVVLTRDDMPEEVIKTSDVYKRWVQDEQ